MFGQFIKKWLWYDESGLRTGAGQGEAGGAVLESSRVEKTRRIAREKRQKADRKVLISELAPLVAEAAADARSAGLRYVSDESPGFTRKKQGKGFVYLDLEGKPIKDERTLRRIRALAIPPAYRDVWISPIENGHLQATARDAAGRKQYRYHPEWIETRSQSKYQRLLEFGEALGKIRRRINQDLHRDVQDRQRIIATAVRLLDVTLIRIGNEDYAEQNDSYGLTTLRKQHVKVNGSEIRLSFRGKSGQWQNVRAEDPRIAKVICRCRELPGCELFQYKDETGVAQKIDSGDVNEYLREIAGEDLTAKHFRTWGGTVLAAKHLASLEPATSQAGQKKQIVEAIKRVAEKLGNRPQICRKYYVHPAVLDAFREGRLSEVMSPKGSTERIPPRNGLSSDERALLDLLKQSREKS